MSVKKIGIIAILVIILGAAINVGMSIAGGFIKKTQEIELVDEEFTRIDIIGDNTTIKVIPTSGANGKVEFIGKKSSRNKVKADVDGDTLHIEMKERRFNFFHFGFNSSNNKIVVSVPDNKYEELTTQTTNGQIIANDLQIEKVDIESNNGKIVLEDLDSKTVNVKTNNGKIDFRHVNGDIHAESDNGQISMVTDNLDRTLTFKTNNGLINIRTSSEPKNATIQAHLDNGKINIFGSANEKTVFGNGENMISIDTDNGVISMTKGN